MELELVDFETAKLLKEKRFDQKITSVGYSTDTKELSYDFPIDLINGKGVAAPTLSLVCKWLRDVHEIDLNIDPEQYMGTRWYEVYVGDIGNVGNGNWIEVNEEAITFNTYEQAQAAGIKEALKLI